MNRLNKMCHPGYRYETIRRWGGKVHIYNALNTRLIFGPAIRDAIRKGYK